MVSRVGVYHPTDLSRVPISGGVEGGAVLVSVDVIMKLTFGRAVRSMRSKIL